MSVAEAVQTTTKASISTSSGFVLQRKCACGGWSGLIGSCAECEKKKFLGKPLQTKLRISEPGDEHEQEADCEAEQVMVFGCPAAQPASIASTITEASEAGQPLSPGTRFRFEAAFGHDFGHVRVHNDPHAHALAQAIDADAFTRGTGIWFGMGKFAPGTAAGDRLLIHELTHIVQIDQSRCSSAADPAILRVGEPAEVDAYANENLILARFGALSGAAKAEVDSPSPAPYRPKVGNRILRRERSRPSSDEEAAENDAVAERTDLVLDQLANDIRSAKSKEAVQLIARVASYKPLREAVARLDDDGLLDVLFRALGPAAWSDSMARRAMLAILPVRAAEKNEATILSQIETGSFKRDLRVSGEEARTVYEILRAMPDEGRKVFFSSPEGQLAFEKLPDRKRPALHLAEQFAFHEEDLEALLAELNRVEVWSPEQEPWLHTLFWMAVQSGHADDPRVVEFVTHNWDTHGHFFAKHGLRADGTMTLTRLRLAPHGFKLLLAGGLLILKSKLFGSVKVVEIALRWLTDCWGKKGAVVKNISLRKLQKALGGTLFGIHLEEFGDTPVSGKLSIAVNPKAGELTITLPSAGIPTASWDGNGIEGPISVTGRDLTLTGVTITSRWPADKTFASVDSLAVRLDALKIGKVVATSAGKESMRLNDLAVSNIEFDIDLGPFREGDGSHLARVVQYLQSQLESSAVVVHAVLAALVSSFNPSAADLTAAFLGDFRSLLADKLGGDLLIKGKVGAVNAGDLTLHGVGSAGVSGGIELVVAAGPRARAALELQRLQRKESVTELSDDELSKKEKLLAVRSNLDRSAANEVLNQVGLDADDVVLELTTPTASDQAPFRLTGVERLPGNLKVEEISGGGATVTVTIPAAAGGTEPLYRIDLDIAEGAVPSRAELDLFSRTASANQLSFTGFSGHAEMLADRTIMLDAHFDQVGCEKLAWGVAIETPGGHATSIDITGSVELTPTGGVKVAQSRALAIDIVTLGADQATIEKAGKYRAHAKEPNLNGLHVVLADGELPHVHLAAGTIAGFDGALGALLQAKSAEPLTFRDFDLGAMVDLGVYRFSFGQLEAGKIDLNAAGNRLVVEYFGGAVGGLVNEVGGLGLDITGGSIELGARQFSLPWIEVTAGSATVPKFTASIVAAVVDVVGPTPQNLSITLQTIDAPVVDVTALKFTLPALGVRGRLARGKGALEGLAVRNVDLELTPDGITIESGTAIVSRTKLMELQTWVRDVAFVSTSVNTGRLTLDFLSDGSGVRFGANDVSFDSKGQVQIKGGNNGAFILDRLTSERATGEISDKEVSANVAVGSLDLGWVDFTYAGVHVTCANATATQLSLSVRAQSVEVPGDDSTLQIVLQAADVPIAHVEGLEFEIPAIGVQGALKDHPGVLEDVKINGVTALLSARGFTVTKGVVAIQRAEAGDALAQIAALLSGKSNLESGSISVEFFSDQRVRFRAEDLSVDAAGEVTVATGSPGDFRLWSTQVASVEGEIAPNVVEGVARGISLGGGFYDDGKLRIDFTDLVVDAAFSEGSLDMQPYQLFSQNVKTAMEAKGIGTLFGIDLASASFLVRDVWQLPGAGGPIGIAHLDAVEAVSQGVSGTFSATLQTVEDTLRFRVDAIIQDGQARGVFSDPRLPLKKDFDAKFTDLLYASKMVLLIANILRNIPAFEGSRQKLETVLADANDKSKLTDIHANLDLRIGMIPIGELGFLRAAAQPAPQVSLSVVDNTEATTKVNLTAAARGLEAVAWDRFVVDMSGVVIDAVEITVTFDGIIPRSVSGFVREGHIDALKWFGAPAFVSP
jgi:hypothetical protein